jgi:hypothetical protein
LAADERRLTPIRIRADMDKINRIYRIKTEAGMIFDGFANHKSQASSWISKTSRTVN